VRLPSTPGVLIQASANLSLDFSNSFAACICVGGHLRRPPRGDQLSDFQLQHLVNRSALRLRLSPNRLQTSSVYITKVAVFLICASLYSWPLRHKFALCVCGTNLLQSDILGSAVLRGGSAGKYSALLLLLSGTDE
jgi:hypothetical protein